MSVPSEPGFLKEVTSAIEKIVEVATKPLGVMSDALSKRLEVWLRRKPRLFVNFHPNTLRWGLAQAGRERMMQVIFMADLSHDDPDSTIILIDGVIKGTGSKLPFRDPITVKPEGLVTVRYPISLIVGPVVGEEGKVLKGRIVFIDQFHRSYKTKTVEFKWAGAPLKQPDKM